MNERNETGAAGQPDEAELQAIVSAIRRTVDPERIVLFGSAARGQMRPDSDIDLMVVKADCRRRATAARIYGELPRRERAVDIMVRTGAPASDSRQ